jgi:AAA domain
VILSSVRTQKPGFLKSEPRMNVALTRCRKGMIIVTNKCFLQGAGKSTLLGKLNRAWSQHRDSWIDWKAMLSDSEHVELPGVSLPPPIQLPQRALKGLKVDSAVQTSESDIESSGHFMVPVSDTGRSTKAPPALVSNSGSCLATASQR